MSYTGKQLIIPGDRGGLSANPNTDNTPPVQMVHPSRNLNLYEMGRTQRGGTSIVRQMLIPITTYDDSFSNLDNWTIVSGSPTISDNQLRLCSNNNETAQVTHVATFSGDFDFQIKVIIDDVGIVENGFDGLTTYFKLVGTTADMYITFLWDDIGEWKYAGGGDLSSSYTSVYSGTAYFRITRMGTVCNAYYGATSNPQTLIATGSTTTEDVACQLVGMGTLIEADPGKYIYYDDFFINAAEIQSAQEILGIYDFTLKDGTQYIVAGDNKGDLYKDTVNLLTSNLGTDNYWSFITFQSNMYIADGYSVPKYWDGVGSVTEIANPAADWVGTDQPTQLIVHGRGQSERVWAIMKGTSNYNNCVYASADGDATDFTTGVIKFTIETNDGHGIVGLAEFGDRLFCFGKTRTYVIDDADDDSDYWGYQVVQWAGGAAHWRLITRVPNDIVCMMENGEIYSVSSAENYGDYKSASITRPAYIDKWIKENADLSKINKFHSIYDPNLRCIKFFMVKSGYQNVNMALCYYIDRDPKEAWMLHENRDNDSGYDAGCAALVRESVGSYKIYTGDYSGRIWELETANKDDNSAGFYCGFKTPMIDCGSPRTTKNFKRIWFAIRPTGGWDLETKWWVDGLASTSHVASIDLSSDSALGTFVLGTNILGGSGFKNVVADVNANGRRIQFECYNDTVSEKIYLSNIMLDYRELGNEPR
jgi:hypothetical protein